VRATISEPWSPRTLGRGLRYATGPWFVMPHYGFAASITINARTGLRSECMALRAIRRVAVSGTGRAGKPRDVVLRPAVTLAQPPVRPRRPAPHQRSRRQGGPVLERARTQPRGNVYSRTRRTPRPPVSLGTGRGGSPVWTPRQKASTKSRWNVGTGGGAWYS
jgi:hypothetical protein